MDQNLIDKIDEIIKHNKDFTRNMSEKLNLIRGGLTKKTEDVEEAYDRGLQDMWEIIYTICADKRKGGLTTGECLDIFGQRTIYGIADNLTYREAVELYKTHMEKKMELVKQAEEEAQTFERGDVVYVNNISRTGIYATECDEYYYVWLEGDHHIAPLIKDVYRITKTGKHIDLSLE